MRLVDDWKKCYKWLSVQIPALGTAAAASYMALPDDWKATVPHWVLALSAALVFISGIVGRLIDQPVVDSDE